MAKWKTITIYECLSSTFLLDQINSFVNYRRAADILNWKSKLKLDRMLLITACVYFMHKIIYLNEFTFKYTNANILHIVLKLFMEKVMAHFLIIQCILKSIGQNRTTIERQNNCDWNKNLLIFLPCIINQKSASDT